MTGAGSGPDAAGRGSGGPGAAARGSGGPDAVLDDDACPGGPDTGTSGPDRAGRPRPPGDRDAAAVALAALLHRWLTSGRARQLVRFELSLEAARRPELEPDLHRAGRGARTRAAGILAALGADRPEEAADLLVAWTDGLLYDRLAGATARSRPAPDPAELASVARRMIDAVLPPVGRPGVRS
nr:hypothetical protein [Streptomyces sp. CB00455]